MGVGVKGGRKSLREVILENRFFEAIERINSSKLRTKRKEIISKLSLLSNSIEEIKVFLIEYLKNGVSLTLKRVDKEIAK